MFVIKRNKRVVDKIVFCRHVSRKGLPFILIRDPLSLNAFLKRKFITFYWIPLRHVSDKGDSLSGVCHVIVSIQIVFVA